MRKSLIFVDYPEGLRPSDSPTRSLAGAPKPRSARVGSLARSFAKPAHNWVLKPVLIIVVALAVSTAVTASQSSSPAPHVFVFTTEPKGATPTEEEQGRLDSVKDVRDALARKAGLTMVTSASDATVLVEVMQRERTDAGGGFGGASVTPLGEVLIRLHLKFGEHETDVKGVAPGYWGRAAKDAADRAFKWIVRIDNSPKRGEQHAAAAVR